VAPESEQLPPVENCAKAGIAGRNATATSKTVGKRIFAPATFHINPPSPDTFLIDRQGVTAAYMAGQADTHDLKANINALLSKR
jgi:hypothetical protein